MADNELEFSAEVGLPFWSSMGVKVAARYKRTWERRKSKYVEDVGRHAGLSADDLATKCLEDTPTADLLILGADRVVKVGDGFYRSAVAELVGRAFADDTKIDEIEYVAALVLKLEPLDLRVVRVAYGDLDDTRWVGETVHPNLVATELDLDQTVVDASLARLGAVGFVKGETKLEDDRMASFVGMRGLGVKPVVRWITTDLGMLAMDLCNLRDLDLTVADGNVDDEA